MKKLVASLMIVLGLSMSSVASAHGPRGYYGGGNVWMPLIVEIGRAHV